MVIIMIDDVVFEDILNEYLELEKEHIHSGKFRVSSAGMCYLRRIWEREGREPTDPFDNETKKRLKLGEIIHNWLESVVEETGYLLVKELEMMDEHRFGKLDVVVKKNGKKILYDFKTVDPRRFAYKDKIDIHYCIQAWTYKFMLEEQFGIKVDSVRLLYVSRDNLLLKEVDISKVMRIEEMVVDDWEGLIKAYQGKGEIIAPKNFWECRRCVYRSGCQYKQGGDN